MAFSHHGLDGAIGPPKPADYSGKAPFPPGTKGYTKTFGRLSLSGGIIKHARSYAGKVELEPTVFGGVQAESATLFGNINRTAFQSVSGGVQADPPIISGSVSTQERTVSGGVSAAFSAVSGTVTAYPLTGWSLTNFTTNYAGLDPDSPFADDPAYSNITHLPTPDKCHYETLTSPDGHTMTMDGLGQFTISPTFLTQTQTFDVQIYDASDQTFGATATITVYPADADHEVAGGVQADAPILSGTVNSFTVHAVSGGVQADAPTLFGIIVKSPDRIIVGGVQAQSATLSGTVAINRIVAGGVQAQSPTVSGSLTKVSTVTGNVQAQSATVSGDLSPPTEEPGTADYRVIGPKFINRKVKWKSNQRRIR